eukprot:745748-Rhodomonas_salina.1
MGATCDRSLVNADVGAMAGVTRDRNCMGRACSPSMSGGVCSASAPASAALSAAALRGMPMWDLTLTNLICPSH